MPTKTGRAASGADGLDALPQAFLGMKPFAKADAFKRPPMVYVEWITARLSASRLPQAWLRFA